MTPLRVAVCGALALATGGELAGVLLVPPPPPPPPPQAPMAMTSARPARSLWCCISSSCNPVERRIPTATEQIRVLGVRAAALYLAHTCRHARSRSVAHEWLMDGRCWPQ